jgi:hypothetical protein
MSNFAERRRQWLAKDPSVHWLHTRHLCYVGPCVCGVQLQSRQRPRKGGEAWKAEAQASARMVHRRVWPVVAVKRLDRGEIGG